jgi:hypothetical protein
MDSIDLDPQPILGMGSDIYDIWKNYGEISRFSRFIGDILIHAF